MQKSNLCVDLTASAQCLIASPQYYPLFIRLDLYAYKVDW